MNVHTASKFVCTVCPQGCLLKVQGEHVSGYQCARGLEYAQEEQTDPRRSISGSVRIIGATQNVLPVKTSKPIPKHLLLEAAKLLHSVTVKAPIKSGDVILTNILGTNIDFIATLSLGDGS